ncbi:hypothetical protein NPIL_335571 [Nephila pilipes]|uniref:Integrase catalytic domain-containing protein n=1 Tax=Nephila pilipes TaxID=299642 RepID=A0A8X6P5F4_NEPPI|nr:hypothetical protein NPIL_335571 [Nephila pilipes]
MLHNMPKIQSPEAYCEPHTTFRFNPERFRPVHVDLVGPFLLSDDLTYLLIRIDCYTRWPEAISLSDMFSETVAKTFIANWPEIHVGNTAYPNYSELHPSSNVVVERLYHSLKQALRCQIDRIITSDTAGSTNRHQGGPQCILS